MAFVAESDWAVPFGPLAAAFIRRALPAPLAAFVAPQLFHPKADFFALPL